MNISDQQLYINTYFGGNIDLLKTISAIAMTWEARHPEPYVHQVFVYNLWLEYKETVFEKTGQFPELIERYWWKVIFETAGLSFIDIIIKPILHDLVKNHWQQFKADFEKAKTEGAIPGNVETAEEYLALRYSPPKTRLYTNDPVYKELGVTSEQGLASLNNAEFTYKIAKMITDGTFLRLHNATYYDYQRDFEDQGKSGKVSFFSDHTRLEPSAEDNLQYLNDSDRLSQFRELAGIGMNTLNDNDSNLVLDTLNALDLNYNFYSKTGYSMTAYDGDQAAAKKKARQRLFRKIREASDKPK